MGEGLCEWGKYGGGKPKGLTNGEHGKTLTAIRHKGQIAKEATGKDQDSRCKPCKGGGALGGVLLVGGKSCTTTAGCKMKEKLRTN